MNARQEVLERAFSKCLELSRRGYGGEGVPTFDVSGQIQADPGEGSLSFQGDALWLQVGHLYLEGLLEDLRHARQVIDLQHLFFFWFNVTLQQVGDSQDMVPGRGFTEHMEMLPRAGMGARGEEGRAQS